MEITFGICGSAGRKEDAARLSKKHFEAMCVVAEGLLEQFTESNYTISCVVSGGAAWADFTAVKLYLDKKVPHLRLFLPAEWQDGRFHDNGIDDSFRNPGKTCNYYHHQFQRNTNINSLSQMQIAKSEGAEFIVVEKGFYARNALVAKSDFLLACTFGEGAQVKKGGTEDTVRKYLNRVRKEGIWDKSFHYNLSDGKVYVGCTVPKENDGLKNAEQILKTIKNLPPHKKLPSIFSP